MKHPLAAARLLVGLALVCASATVSPITAAAQQFPFDLSVETGASSYRSDVPTPEQVIGHRIGSRHTRPDQLVEYSAPSRMRATGWCSACTAVVRRPAAGARDRHLARRTTRAWRRSARRTCASPTRPPR
jgi:hypothetical protein